MKTFLKNLFPVAPAIFVFCLVANGQSQRDTSTEPNVPVIKMENVPLSTAIENLGRQAGMNFTVDPRILGGGLTNSENAKWRSPVTLRWENMTAEDALARLLKERDLFIVKHPQTGVVKITGTNSPPRVFEQELLDSSKDVIPLIQMMDVPLDAALGNLGTQAKLKLELDPRLSDTSRPFSERVFVSVRFEGLTAGQALAAICDQHNLQIAKSEEAGVWRVSQGQ